MDISNFISSVEEMFKSVVREPRLKTIRKSRGLSQSELSKLSRVSLPTIRSYEQRGNEIDKAQSHALYELSRVLGCHIEDLLENPME